MSFQENVLDLGKKYYTVLDGWDKLFYKDHTY